MCQDHLSNIVVLNIGRYVANKLDLVKTISTFVDSKTRPKLPRVTANF